MATTTGLISTVRSSVEERTPDLQTVRVRAEDLRDRAGAASEAMAAGVPDLEPLARRAAVSLLEAFQAIVSVVLLLPRLVLRALGLLRAAAIRMEGARERGEAITDRARDAVRTIPPSRRGRWQRRRRDAGLMGAAFVAGAAVGWLVAARRDAHGAQTAPVMLQPVVDGPELEVTEAGSPDGPVDRQAGTGA